MTSTRPEDGATTLTTERVGAALVLRVRGDVDSYTVPDLRSAMFEAVVDGTGPLVLDLSQVRFLSSTGLRLLIDVRDAVNGRSVRVVTGGNRAVDRPLEITGVDGELCLYPDLASALA